MKTGWNDFSTMPPDNVDIDVYSQKNDIGDENFMCWITRASWTGNHLSSYGIMGYNDEDVVLWRIAAPWPEEDIVWDAKQLGLKIPILLD